jgi:hypothetical protein
MIIEQAGALDALQILRCDGLALFDDYFAYR